MATIDRYAGGGRSLPLVLAAVLVLCLLAAGGALSQQEDLDERIQGKEGELDKLRKAITEQRGKIREVEKEEKNISDYLKKLGEEEELTRALLGGLEEKGTMLEEQVLVVRADLATSETVFRHRLDVLARRVREMYKEGPRHMWQDLLDANDFADLLQRYKFLSMIAERDAALVAEVRRRKAGIERQEAALTELFQEVSSARNEKELELARLEDNQQKRKESLSELQRRKGRYQRKAEELAQAEKQLQDLIDRLEKQRIEQAREWGEYGERNFLDLKGTMSTPVEGRVVRRFGRFKHPEFGTVTFNTGLDIESRTGSPVRAVARGKVEFSGSLPGYGNCIIVNHGGGYYTLYAHASRVFVEQGKQIEAGHVIAETGAGTESAPTPLHFEIRKSKTALDPGEWLAR